MQDFRYELPSYTSYGGRDPFEGVNQFIDNGMIKDPSRYYSWIGVRNDHLYQGDGVEGLLTVNLPNPRIEPKSGIILSNTCDIAPENKRNEPAKIVYAPLINFDKLVKRLKEKGLYNESQVQAIKDQHITSIFYLPKHQKLVSDSLVFLDHINSCSGDMVAANDVPARRIFSLSMEGFWLFTVKLALHFTRHQEAVERG